MKSKNKRLTKRIGILLGVVALFCATLAFSVFASETSPERISADIDACYTVGDINEDGSVTSKDAIKLLYSSLTQSDKAWDFNNDNTVDGKDAIYLLYSVNELFADLFPSVEKTVHVYGEPTWVLDVENESAVAVYTCACGRETKNVHAEFTVDKKDATCTENGYVKYEASSEFGGKVDVTTKDEILEAKGHVLTSKIACVDRECQACDYTVKAGEHNFGEEVTVPATCTEAKCIKKTCLDCGVEHKKYEGEAAGHTYTMSEVHVDKCTYQNVYECSVCQDKQLGETFAKHELIVSYTKEPTCTAAGEKVTACKYCGGEKKTEAVAKDADAHIWDNGVDNGDVTTYTCTNGCGKTKTTVNAKTSTSTTVSQETLKEVEEVEVNNAAIKLDDATKEQLQGEVAITVDTVNKAELGLSAEQKEQIGNNPVYDFSLTENGTTVPEFDGTVTVTLPYELQEGDDVESIYVWYIKDDGTVDLFEGKYSNGYVTFETSHFSYYTVTRLTPAQRCAMYGHSLRTGNPVAPTCETEGYTLELCVRCGYKAEVDKVPALGHDITRVETAATCEQDGVIQETCSNEGCSLKNKTVIPKTGHKWETTSKVDSTCAVAGSEELKCTNAGCNATNKVVYDKLPHDFKQVSVAPTCDAKGYVGKECKNCTYKETADKAALGHAYKETWAWSEKDGALTATLTLTCENDATHTVVKEAVINIAKQVAPTCEKDGKITYEATASHNQKVYTDTYEVAEEKFEHRISDKLEFHTTKHFNTCTICGARVNEEAHEFDAGSVVKAATCQAEGEAVFTCECGYSYTDKISKTEHNLVNGTCSDCGFKTEECTHETMHKEYLEVEATENFCGVWIEFEVCDCGERRWIYDSNMMCDESELGNWEYFVSDEGFYLSKVAVDCAKCGTHLTGENTAEVISKEACEVVFGMKYKFTTKAGEVVADFVITEGYPEHALRVYEKETDLTQYGLCDGKMVELSCVCGQNYGFDYTTEKCEWKWNEEISGDRFDYYTCTNCGVQRKNTWSDKEVGSCQWNYGATFTFIKEGKDLITFERDVTETYHTWEDTPVLLGETCADGISVSRKCTECGATDEYMSTPESCENAVFYTTETIEVDGSCEGYINVSTGTCACGAYEDSYVYVPGCNWSWGDYSEYVETENGFTTTETQKCIDCGIEEVSEYAYTATDMKCQFVGTRTSKYYIGEKELATTTSEIATHREDIYGKLAGFEFLGETCEDGVIATIECSVCGDTNTEEYYHHRNFEMEKYDLADYGMCGGEIIVWGCACGLDGWIEFTEDEEGCNWSHWYYDDETETSTYKCRDCGAMYSRQYIAELDGCFGTNTTRYEFTKGYNVVLEVEDTSRYEEHLALYEYALDVPGGSCSDGYTVYETCSRCDGYWEWHQTSSEDDHWTRPVERYSMADYGFCGGEVVKYSCACGERSELGRDVWEWCNFNWYQYDEAANITWYKCSECGNFVSETSKELAAEGCNRTMETAYTFYDVEKNPLFTGIVEERWTNHNATYTFELDVPGGSCSDGYTVTESCKACGEVRKYYERPEEGEHWTYEIERYDLSEYGFCGGYVGKYTCPCGTRQGTFENDMACNWYSVSYDEDEANGTVTSQEVCEHCNKTRVVTQGNEVQVGCVVSQERTVQYCDEEFVPYFSFEGEIRGENHDFEYQFNLDGETCSDGYEINMVCRTCGASGSQYERPEEGEHWTYMKETYNLADYGFCENHGEIRYWTCPCGEREGYDDCLNNFDYLGWDGEFDAEYYQCNDCNSFYTYKWESTKLEGCMEQATREYRFFNKAGEEVLTLEASSKEEAHDMEVSFRRLGETCEEGYYVVRTCRDCGVSWDESGLRYGHESWRLETVDAAELGLCGGELRHYGCACGKNDHWESDLACEFEYIQDDGSQWTAQCVACGIIRKGQNNYSQIDDCHELHTHKSEFYRGEEKVFEYSYENISEYHDGIYQLTLMNPGTTCHEGVYVHRRCQRCGDEETWESYGHDAYCVEELFVGMKGTCGTTIRKYTCACGEDSWYERYTEGCSWSYITDNTYKCDTCGVTRVYTSTESPKDDNCQYEVVNTWQYYDAAGNLACEFTNTEIYEDHSYEVVDYVMNDPSDCEAGYQETCVCKDCGDMYVAETWYHATKIKYDYNLADFGGCAGSRIWYEECYCGENVQLNTDLYSYCNIYSSYNRYEDELGRLHFVEVRRCDNCDLMYTVNEIYVRDAATCVVTRTYDVSIAVGDTAVGAFTYERSESSHDYVTTGSLLPGAVDCEDGVELTNTCRDCGDTYSYTEYYHREFVKERYDIADFGAECGGEVRVTGCACGKNIYINKDETLCDWDYNYNGCEYLYLGDQLDNQYGVDGEVSVYRWSNNYKCAVTDPTECGFIIRVCEYPVWDKANCVARRYVTWQLGYDEATGTYAKEITIATGETYAYHDYETTYTDIANGTVSGSSTTGVCKTCGSSYEKIYTYDSSTQATREESRATNLANNGKNQFRERIYEYRYFMDAHFTLLDYEKLIYADGSEYWYKAENLTDFANYNCQETIRYSGSETETYDSVGEHHINQWERIYDYTCSQYAYEVGYCKICNKDMGESQWGPYGHSWYWDESLGLYRCGVCDLESVSGADGAVVLEDLTDKNGNGTDYVVGYHKFDQDMYVEYTYYVSLVLPTGEEVFIDVAFEELDRKVDGIQAITFDKAEVTAAAAAAGYTTYDVRFAFVPVGADGSLDYAITLTN